MIPALIASVRAFFSGSWWLTEKGVCDGLVRHLSRASGCLAYFFGLIVYFTCVSSAVAAVPGVPQYSVKFPSANSPTFYDSTKPGLCAQVKQFGDTCTNCGDPTNLATRIRPMQVSYDPVWNNCKLNKANGSEWSATGAITTSTVCPANSTSSGGQCVCTSGYIEYGGQCITQDTRCKASIAWESQTNGVMGVYGAVRDYLGDRASGSLACFEFFDNHPSGSRHGCFLEFDRFITFTRDGGQVVSGGRYRASSSGTGLACNPDNQATKPPAPSPCPSGQSQGTFNGQTICHDVGPESETRTDKPTTRTETEVTQNGDGTRTETTRTTTTQTTCTGGSCNTVTTVTTTTQTINNSDNSVVNTTTNTTEGGTTNPFEGFCKENPNSPICNVGDEGDGSSWGGSCASGFQCKGDAIQCAMARDQHLRNCQAFEPQGTPEEALYAQEKGKEGKVTDGLPGNVEVNVGALLSATGDEFLGGGSCPADYVVSLWDGQSFTIPFERLCPTLAIMGNILMVISSIVGAFIIFRRKS